MNKHERTQGDYPVMGPSYRRCKRCSGEGYIGVYYTFQTCPLCGGVGVVLVPPTDQRQPEAGKGK